MMSFEKMKAVKKSLAFGLATLTLGAALAGCGAEKSASTEKKGPSISGKVAVDGSTSMEKVIGSLGEVFTGKNPGVTFTYNPTGSGSGIKAVQNGRCDIGLSSRYLKEAELKDDLKEVILAYDGIAIIVNEKNPVQNLSQEQLAAVYRGEIKDWSELGGAAGPIVRIGREAGSGTRDGFESVTRTKDKCKYGQELTSTGDVIATVAANPAAIGYASVSAVGKKVKTLAVDNVMPTEKTIVDKSYKVQRPFVLALKKSKPLSGAAKAFCDFALSREGAEIIKKAGAIPVPEKK